MGLFHPRQCPRCNRALPAWKILSVYSMSFRYSGRRMQCPHCAAWLRPEFAVRMIQVLLLWGMAIVAVVFDVRSYGVPSVFLVVVCTLLVTSVIPAFLPGPFLFEVVDEAEVLRREPGLRIDRRRCPHCGNVVSYVARTCPKCAQRLYPPLHPTTHDKIASLLQQIDKQSLTSPPEEYFTKAQEHAWNRQVKEAALELGKVLLTSPPKSDIHLKAERLLKKMGYRF